MARPIYSMFLMKYTEAWYRLSQQEKDTLRDKIGDSLKSAGAEVVAFCDSSWSTDSWFAFGLVKFPNLEAVQKHREDTNKLEWARYTEAMSVLGTEVG